MKLPLLADNIINLENQKKSTEKNVRKIRDKHGCYIWDQLMKPVVFLYDEMIYKSIFFLNLYNI